MTRELVGAIALYAARMAAFVWLLSIILRADVWIIEGLPERLWHGAVSSLAGPLVWFAFFFVVMSALVWLIFRLTRKL